MICRWYGSLGGGSSINRQGYNEDVQKDMLKILGRRFKCILNTSYRHLAYAKIIYISMMDILLTRITERITYMIYMHYFTRGYPYLHLLILYEQKTNRI